MASVSVFVRTLDNYDVRQYAQYLALTLNFKDSPQRVRIFHYGQPLARALRDLFPRTIITEDLRLDNIRDQRTASTVIESTGKAGEICIVPSSSFDYVLQTLRHVDRTDELVVRGTETFSTVKVKKELDHYSHLRYLDLARPLIEKITASVATGILKPPQPEPLPIIQSSDDEIVQQLIRAQTELLRPSMSELQRDVSELQAQVNRLQETLQEQMSVATALQSPEVVRLSPISSPPPIRIVLAVNFSKDFLGDCCIRVQYSSRPSCILPWRYPISPGCQSLGYDPQCWGRETIQVALVQGEKVISNVLQVELT